MTKILILALLFMSSQYAYSADISLSDETVIIAQMITDPEVQKCIQQIEAEYKGHFRIRAIVRRPLQPDTTYEEGSAAIAAHSTYFFRGSVGGPSYKGPSAVAVEKVQGGVLSKYACRILDQMPY
ncbi:hypothetical protein BDW_08465 [Bdellovibrio bacteriovorus W]|nr:hypothetical protein BDW_08465 [Bdellovibrio bacteriovorus W]